MYEVSENTRRCLDYALSCFQLFLERDLATARNPTADLPAEEDSASEDTGSAERSPRLALPVPVGMVETQADEADEATEDEAMNAEPSYAFAKGYGRFGISYTRPATALGNFEQGDIGAESAVVAQWLTSGLRIAMSRTGWNLMSTRFSLTKVPGSVLSDHYRKGYPFTPKMADRPCNQYGTIHHSEEKWDQLCGWLTGNPTFRIQLASHKQALRDHIGYSQEATKARRTDLPTEVGSSSTAAGSFWRSKPPPPPSPSGWSYGWWQECSRHSESSHTTIASVSLNLLHEMGELSHLLHCGLVSTMALQRTHPLHLSFFSTSTDAVWAWCPGHR